MEKFKSCVSIGSPEFHGETAERIDKAAHLLRAKFFFRKANHGRYRASATNPLSNQRGFVVVAAVSFFFVFVIAVFSVLITTWLLGEKEKLQYSCEKHNLAAQQILIDGAYDLIALNPDVESLVSQKQQLEYELLIAMGPEKAAIAAQLLIVRGRMFLLKLRQKALIRKAETAAALELRKIETAARAQTHDIIRKWQNGKLSSWTRYRRPRMQVDPHYKDHLLPTYEFGIGYRQRQNIQVDITIRGLSPLPEGIIKILRNRTLQWREKCSSEPRQERGPAWQSRLAVVKLW